MNKSHFIDTTKKMLISVVYWYLLAGIYFLCFNINRDVFSSLYSAFIYLWYAHLAVAAILSVLSYFLHLIIKRM